MLPLEVKSNTDFYNIDNKLSLSAQDRCQYVLNPKLSRTTLKTLIMLSYQAISSVSCAAITRLDFILSKSNIPFLLEANTLPGLAENSNLVAMFSNHGYHYDEMVIELIKNGLLSCRRKDK